MQQYLIVGINDFGGAVLERTRALPIERNVVYHRLDCPPGAPVGAAYLDFRRRLLDVLNKEVYNFANTQLTVYLVGLLVEEHMAENLMHLGYLFKSFFRENIILNPRVKLLTAFPTIIPEEAYAWLPATRRTLDQIDRYASLKEQFQPQYPEVKRPLPAISGPPFEDAVFCYSESLDEDDVAVSAQAAATKIYFDLMVLPERLAAQPALAEFYRSFPAGQGFAPISGSAVAFLPSLARLVRDEMEYVLMMRLCARFLPLEPPDSAAMDGLVEDVLRKARCLRIKDLVDDVVEQALEKERWFDLAGIDALAKYDIEMSPSPEAYLTSFLASLERERNRFAGRVRDLALEVALGLPDRIVAAVREGHPQLDLWALDTLFTRAFFRVAQLVDQASSFARQAKSDWEQGRQSATAKAARLRDISGAKDARMKHGSETESRIEEVFRTVDTRALLRQSLAMTVADSLAQEAGLDARLREGYDKVHELYASFLKRRTELMTHLTSRRDGYLKRRELYLYVFNQVFRQRVLDREIDKKLSELQEAAARPGGTAGCSVPNDPLARVMGDYFFKRWAIDPTLPLDEVEKELMEAIRLKARAQIEKAAADLEVDYTSVVRILHEIASDQAHSIFDMKYKEHPQAAYRQAMFLLHKQEDLPGTVAQKIEGIDVTDIACVKDLPFQVLQVSEIYNLPLRALRQYASMDRDPTAGVSPGTPPPPRGS